MIHSRPKSHHGCTVSALCAAADIGVGKSVATFACVVVTTVASSWPKMLPKLFGRSSILKCLAHGWFEKSLFASSAIALVLVAAAAFGQSNANSSNTTFLSRSEGKYAGTINKWVTATLGWRGPRINRDGTRKIVALDEVLNKPEEFGEPAQDSSQRVQYIPIQLSVSEVNDHWMVELRQTDDQSGSPLPSVVNLNIPKVLAPLSAVQVDGFPAASWLARATHNDRSLTIYLIEANASSTPVQMQITLQEAGHDIDIVLWLISRIGHRGISWGGALERQ